MKRPVSAGNYNVARMFVSVSQLDSELDTIQGRNRVRASTLNGWSGVMNVQTDHNDVDFFRESGQTQLSRFHKLKSNEELETKIKLYKQDQSLQLQFARLWKQKCQETTLTAKQFIALLSQIEKDFYSIKPELAPFFTDKIAKIFIKHQMKQTDLCEFALRFIFYNLLTRLSVLQLEQILKDIYSNSVVSIPNELAIKIDHKQKQLNQTQMQQKSTFIVPNLCVRPQSELPDMTPQTSCQEILSPRLTTFDFQSLKEPPVTNAKNKVDSLIRTISAKRRVQVVSNDPQEELLNKYSVDDQLQTTQIAISRMPDSKPQRTYRRNQSATVRHSIASKYEVKHTVKPGIIMDEETEDMVQRPVSTVTKSNPRTLFKFVKRIRPEIERTNLKPQNFTIKLTNKCHVDFQPSKNILSGNLLTQRSPNRTKLLQHHRLNIEKMLQPKLEIISEKKPQPETKHTYKQKFQQQRTIKLFVPCESPKVNSRMRIKLSPKISERTYSKACMIYN